jgi:hypothetical protein
VFDMGSMLLLNLAVVGPFLAAVSPAVAPPGAAAFSGCEIEVHGSAPTDAADEALALRACEHARARFGELFEGAVPPVRVLLWDWPGYRTGAHEGVAIVLWPKGVALVDAGGGGEQGARHAHSQWRDVLPHEISHALLSARFFDDGSEGHEGYGTPFPDWLDEGVAIWAESRRSVAGRLAHARRLAAKRLDLVGILSLVHPGAGNDAVLAIRDGAAIPQDDALWAFYPQSIAVLSFVHELGGRAAVTEVARRLLATPENPAVLAGLPGLPDTMAAVVAAWEAWLRR